MHFLSRHLKSFLISGILWLPAFTLAQSTRALLVGISDYASSGKGQWNNINGVNDVNLIAQDLRKQPFSQVVTLKDQQATFKNICAELTQLANMVEKGDIIYIHLSGHGQPVLDLDGDEGKTDGWDESFIPIDADQIYEKGRYEGKAHLTDDVLEKYLHAIRTAVGPKGMVYLTIDACYSGGASRGDEEDNSDVDEDAPLRGTSYGFDFGQNIHAKASINRKTTYAVHKIPEESHLIVMEACLPYQRSREVKENGLYYGPLSLAVHRALGYCKISGGPRWVRKVIQEFKKDRRIVNQSMVCESSINIKHGK